MQHWKNLVPHGVSKSLYSLLIPMEIVGMLVRPFALTMRLAANMTGGHIAILAIMSFVFIFTEMLGQLDGESASVSRVSVPLGVGISGSGDHRRARSGVRVYAVDGRVHRHGHSRASLNQLNLEDSNAVPSRVKHVCLAALLGFAHRLGRIGWDWPRSEPDSALASWRPGSPKASRASRAPRHRSRGATNLPLFLLEGVAILAEVFCLIIRSC